MQTYRFSKLLLGKIDLSPSSRVIIHENNVLKCRVDNTGSVFNIWLMKPKSLQSHQHATQDASRFTPCETTPQIREAVEAALDHQFLETLNAS
jgi:hypothetical protein